MLDVVHICVAMKPLDGTFASNALEYGVAGLNIDECRVGTNEDPSGKRRDGKPPVREAGLWANDRRSPETFAAKRNGEASGRWPANVILGGSDEVKVLFPDTGPLCGGQKRTTHSDGMFGIGTPGKISTGDDRGNNRASRFFKKCSTDGEGD